MTPLWPPRSLFCTCVVEEVSWLWEQEICGSVQGPASSLNCPAILVLEFWLVESKSPIVLPWGAQPPAVSCGQWQKWGKIQRRRVFPTLWVHCGERGSPDHTWPLVPPLIVPWGDYEWVGGQTGALCLFLKWVVLVCQRWAKIGRSLFCVLFSLAECAVCRLQHALRPAPLKSSLGLGSQQAHVGSHSKVLLL